MERRVDLLNPIEELEIKLIEVVVDQLFIEVGQLLETLEFFLSNVDSFLNRLLSLSASGLEPISQVLDGRGKHEEVVAGERTAVYLFGTLDFDFQNANLLVLLDVHHLF